jgi:hypothetical protein
VSIYKFFLFTYVKYSQWTTGIWSWYCPDYLDRTFKLYQRDSYGPTGNTYIDGILVV